METPRDDREMPADVAERFQVALRLDEPPATLGEWADATFRRLGDAEFTFGFEELCLTESSRHEARVGDEVRRFRCVLDTLLLPFVLDDPREIDVRSRSPVSDAAVEFSVTREDVSVTPDDAVMSFGIAADVDPPEDGDPLAYGYRAFCPYINAFADETAYEEWAAETPEAVTMALPLAEGAALARRLGRRLTE